jgi:hypothetical protein
MQDFGFILNKNLYIFAKYTLETSLTIIVMYRTVFTPTEKNNIVPFIIPREWYGKDVELIVFPLDLPQTPLQSAANNQKFIAIPPQYSFSTKNFKFNRDEANNYE